MTTRESIEEANHFRSYLVDLEYAFFVLGEAHAAEMIDWVQLKHWMVVVVRVSTLLALKDRSADVFLRHISF